MPTEERWPNTPQNDAGTRIEPPVAHLDDLCSGYGPLADDEVVLETVDHLLELRVLVAGDEDEAVRVLSDRCVRFPGDVDRCGARDAAALAADEQLLSGREVLELVVDLPVDRLVRGDRPNPGALTVVERFGFRRVGRQRFERGIA